MQPRRRPDSCAPRPEPHSRGRKPQARVRDVPPRAAVQAPLVFEPVEARMPEHEAVLHLAAALEMHAPFGLALEAVPQRLAWVMPAQPL